MTFSVDEPAMRSLCDEYFKGLCWVIRYYNAAVPSWSWVYRHHYAAFASDLAVFVQYALHVAFSVGPARASNSATPSRRSSTLFAACRQNPPTSFLRPTRVCSQQQTRPCMTITPCTSRAT